VDSTLGFTALDGLCMGTRPGTIDPGVILHLFQGLGLTPKEVETMLYKQSGLLGISGHQQRHARPARERSPEAELAVDFFVYQAAKQIGALAAVLGGVDCIVFTAGIGEHSAPIRRRLCEASAWLGVALTRRTNRQGGPRISTPDSKFGVGDPDQRELMIARHTGAMLGIAGQRA
jgi:acetate kinase